MWNQDSAQLYDEREAQLAKEKEQKVSLEDAATSVGDDPYMSEYGADGTDATMDLADFRVDNAEGAEPPTAISADTDVSALEKFTQWSVPLVAAIKRNDSRAVENAVLNGTSVSLTAENLKAMEVELSKFGDHVSSAPPPSLNHVPKSVLKKMMTSEKAAKSTIDPASHLMQVMKKSWTEQELADFEHMSRPEQREHKRKWAERTLEATKSKYETSRKYMRIDTKLGKYRNAGQVIIDEGGWSDPEAIEGSLRLFAQCNSMGGKWIGKHPQTGRRLYLCLSFEFSEVFEECWADFESHVDELANTKDNAALPGGITDTTEKLEVEGEKGEAVEGEPTPSTTEPKQPKQPRPQGKPQDESKIEERKVWSLALKTRAQMLPILALADATKKKIEAEEPGWSRLNNQANLGKLRSKLTDLHACLSPTLERFLTEDTNQVKKSFKNATKELTSELKKFNNLMAMAKEVEFEVTTLVSLKDNLQSQTASASTAQGSGQKRKATQKPPKAATKRSKGSTE